MSLDEKKIDALKAWYSLFGVILGMQELDDAAKIAKLTKLRAEIDRAVEGIQ
jgi:hypothetical protein